MATKHIGVFCLALGASYVLALVILVAYLLGGLLFGR